MNVREVAALEKISSDAGKDDQFYSIGCGRIRRSFGLFR